MFLDCGGKPDPEVWDSAFGRTGILTVALYYKTISWKTETALWRGREEEEGEGGGTVEVNVGLTLGAVPLTEHLLDLVLLEN